MLWRYACRVLVLLFVFGSFACSSDEASKGLGVSEGCLLNSDCASPLVCAFRKCHQACQSSGDCTLGERCVASDKPNYVCQLADERDCTRNSQCPAGQICGVDLQCRDQCVTERDCLKGQECVASTCADTQELNDGGLIPLTPDGATSSNSGAPCLYNSDCTAPQICRDGACTNECQKDADCRNGSTCVGNRCVPPDVAVIGPSGGKVLSLSGTVQLDIAPGALRSPVFISILALDAWPDGAVGPAFEILPSGTVFNPPATLTISYKGLDLQGQAPDTLRLAQALGAKWTALPTTVDAVSGALVASIAHLSVYGIIRTEQPMPDGSAADAINDAGAARDQSAADQSTRVDSTVPDQGTVDQYAAPDQADLPDEAAALDQTATPPDQFVQPDQFAVDESSPVLDAVAEDASTSTQVCGNGIVEPGETCDGETCTCKQETTTCFGQTGSAETCDVTCHQAVSQCISGDGCCPYGIGCTSDNDSDCASQSDWQYVRWYQDVDYSNGEAGPNPYCATVYLYGIEAGGSYLLTTCSPPLGVTAPEGAQAAAMTGAGTGDPVITSIKDGMGNPVPLVGDGDDCLEKSAIPNLLNWNCQNDEGLVTMSCASQNNGGFQVAQQTWLTVTICAKNGAAGAGIAPLYIFYNTPSGRAPNAG